MHEVAEIFRDVGGGILTIWSGGRLVVYLATLPDRIRAEKDRLQAKGKRFQRDARMYDAEHPAPEDAQQITPPDAPQIEPPATEIPPPDAEVASPEAGKASGDATPRRRRSRSSHKRKTGAS